MSTAGLAATAGQHTGGVNLVVVLDASLALGAQFWSKYGQRYIANISQKIDPADGGAAKQEPLNVAFVSYGAADTRPSPIFARRYFQPWRQALSDKTTNDMPGWLGLGQVGVRSKNGMAVLEGLVAALELCESCIDMPIVESIQSLHRNPPTRPPRPQLHILLFAARPPDEATTPSWNTSAVFDSVTWDTLADEMKKRDIGFNMILTNPNPKLADLHKAVVPNPMPPWFASPAPGHSFFFQQFAPTKAAHHHPVLQPKMPQENKRPLEDPASIMPDAKRFKPSPITLPAPAISISAAPKVEAANTASSSNVAATAAATAAMRQHQAQVTLQQYQTMHASLRADAEVAQRTEAQGKSAEEVAALKQQLLFKASMLKKIHASLVQRGLLTPDGKPTIPPLNATPAGPLAASGSSAPPAAKTEFNANAAVTGQPSAPVATTTAPSAAIQAPLRNVAPAPQPPAPLQPPSQPPALAPAAMQPKPPLAPGPPPNMPTGPQVPAILRNQILAMTRSTEGLTQLKRLLAMKPELKGLVTSIWQNHSAMQGHGLVPSVGQPPGSLPPVGQPPSATPSTSGQVSIPAQFAPQAGPSNLFGMVQSSPSSLPGQHLQPAVPQNPQPSQTPASQKPVWQGTITWTIQNTVTRIVPVIAMSPRGDLRFDLWPVQLQLKANKKTFTRDELIKWTERNRPALCSLHIAPEAAGTEDENRMKELIALLVTKQAIATSHVPVPGMTHGIHLVVFTVQATMNTFVVAAFVDRPVPELIDPPPQPPPPQALQALQGPLIFQQLVASLTPEQKAQIQSMPEHLRLQGMQRFLVQRQQQQQLQQQQQQQQQQSSMLAAAGIPMLQSPFLQQQPSTGFGQQNAPPQPGVFGGQASQMPPGMNFPQTMNYPHGFQNQPWQQRPPGS